MRQRLPGDEACLDLAHVMLIEEVCFLSLYRCAFIYIIYM